MNKLGTTSVVKAHCRRRPASILKSADYLEMLGIVRSEREHAGSGPHGILLPEDDETTREAKLKKYTNIIRKAVEEHKGNLNQVQINEAGNLMNTHKSKLLKNIELVYNTYQHPQYLEEKKAAMAANARVRNALNTRQYFDFGFRS